MLIILFLVAFTVPFLLNVWHGMTKGTVKARRGQFSRTAQPRTFWFVIAADAIIALIGLAILTKQIRSWLGSS